MSQVFSVREYARLSTEPVAPSLDCAQVSESAFNYLCSLNESFSKTGARLVQVEGRRWLRLDNYVGVLHTPCGTTLEILPKHHHEGASVQDCRVLLRKMLLAALDLTAREAGEAALQRFEAPLTEWVMRRFLSELDRLVKRGVRFEYVRVEEELPFLRGQLNVVAQLRSPPGRDHRFQVRHDTYTPDRPENRLLKLALDRLRASTRDPDNWRLAQELSIALSEIPSSRDIASDFKAWGTGRLATHYRAVKPWCELILQREMPLALLGDHQGLSLLFPMEKVFERYVATWLRAALGHGVGIRAPASSESLCVHMGQAMFQLEPDVLLTSASSRSLLDMKWKRLDSSDRERKYRIDQGDMYQLFAYGQKYMGGAGVMALVYPRWEGLLAPLPPFQFSNDLVLHVLPFDLDEDRLLGFEVLGDGLFGPQPRLAA